MFLGVIAGGAVLYGMIVFFSTQSELPIRRRPPLNKAL